MNKFVIISLFLVIIAAYIAVSGLFSSSSRSGSSRATVTPTAKIEPVACTLDAKVCPDGSSVGRMPPTCEFAPCPSGTSSSSPSAGAELYESSRLGIRFSYLKSQSNEEIEVTEQGSRIIIYPKNLGPSGGQSVEVFTKDPVDTLQQAIQKQFLSDKDTAQCVVLAYRLDPAYPQTFQGAEIGYPIEGPDPSQLDEMAQRCAANYAKTNGIRYFLYDPAHPDTYLFFNIGQYGILAAESVPWQTTVTLYR